jgi:hypothetical protein
LAAAAALLGAYGLGACATKTPRTAADISEIEIARYRFGMDQECRAAGRLHGETAASIEEFCNCAYDTLERNGRPDDWRRLVFLNDNGQGDEERRALAPLLAGVSACRLQRAASAAAAEAAASPAAALVGLWAWKRPFDGCKEAFEFRDNGTVRIERNNERTESAYAVASAPETSGRLKVSLTVTRAELGTDCNGMFRGTDERSAPLFILFGYRNKMLAVCESADGEDCAGPLQREEQGH